MAAASSDYELAVIAAVLAELMHNAESETVRVAAAKTLLEKVLPMTQADDKGQARQDVLNAITALLDELAHARTAGLAIAPDVDQGRAPEPDHAAGAVAHLADHGGAGLGKNPHRG